MVRYVTSVCSHNCPDICGVRVGVEDGRIVSLAGDPDHPITRGFLCGKVSRYAERVYSPERVLTPLRRIGAKGEGRFAPISWDEALDEIAHRFKETSSRYGAEAILPYNFSGTVAKVAQYSGEPLFNGLGASRLARTICSTQASEGQRFTTGYHLSTDIEELPHAKLIVLWGSNAVSTNIHLMPFVQQARKNGATLVVIDPHRNRTARRADWHLPIRPGTDIALALGMMRLLIAEELLDRDFIAKYTLGFDALRESCAEYTPERVAGITGLSEQDVVRLARLYGTTRASFIRLGLGLTRRRDGGMVVRTVACLPCLTGAWEERGGGFQRNAWGNQKLNLAYLTQPRPGDPKARTVNMVRLGEALTTLKDPPVHALYVYHSNPAAVAPEQAQVHAGLMREDLFVAVHEQMFTDTTDFADIVLPAPTFLEQDDLGAAAGHWYVQIARRAIAPLGEARGNLEVFRALAARLGVDHPAYRESFDEIVAHLLETDWAPAGGWDLAALRAGKAQRMQPPDKPWRSGRLKTPSGKFELYSEPLARLGLSPVPVYVPSPEGQLDNALKARYPLQLLTPHSHHLINSSFGNVPSARRLERGPALRLNPADAAARGLQAGDPCRVFNGRGQCTLPVRVTEDVRPGVCVADSVWWPRDQPGRRNVNQLISQDQTDVGAGARFQECLVQVDPITLRDTVVREQAAD
jgi:anaerobic selenocysteine-containing dehydrogenase